MTKMTAQQIKALIDTLKVYEVADDQISIKDTLELISAINTSYEHTKQLYHSSLNDNFMLKKKIVELQMGFDYSQTREPDAIVINNPWIDDDGEKIDCITTQLLNKSLSIGTKLYANPSLDYNKKLECTLRECCDALIPYMEHIGDKPIKNQAAQAWDKAQELLK